MTDKIKEEKFGEQTIAQPKNYSNKNGPKYFKKYLVEGIMIFIAVSMSFIAENVREYFADIDQEHRYIEALVSDIKSDTINIGRTIRDNLEREILLDSLLMISNLDLTENENAKQLVRFFMLAAYKPTHIPNSVTVTQLKNTGSFRLFNHRNGVADSVLRYDRLNQRIIEHNEFYSNDLNLIWEAFYPICDIKIFRDPSFVTWTESKRELTAKQIPPLNLTHEKLSVFTGHITRQILINSVNRTLLKLQLRRASSLLDFLGNEYHLE